MTRDERFDLLCGTVMLFVIVTGAVGITSAAVRDQKSAVTPKREVEKVMPTEYCRAGCTEQVCALEPGDYVVHKLCGTAWLGIVVRISSDGKNIDTVGCQDGRHVAQYNGEIYVFQHGPKPTE